MNNFDQRGIGQLIVVGFVLFLAIIVGGIYYYTILDGDGGDNDFSSIDQSDTLSPSPEEQTRQTDEDTESEFETYVSEEYNFSIDYPSDWRLDDNLGQDRGYLQFFNYPEDKYLGGEDFLPGDVKIEIFAHDNENMLTLEEFAQDSIAGGMYDAEDYTFSRTTLGNSSAIVSRFEGESSFRTYYVEVGNDTILTVSLFPDVEHARTEEVLSSFEVEKQ